MRRGTCEDRRRVAPVGNIPGESAWGDCGTTYFRSSGRTTFTFGTSTSFFSVPIVGTSTVSFTVPVSTLGVSIVSV
jgi:hypothetical protein